MGTFTTTIVQVFTWKRLPAEPDGHGGITPAQNVPEDFTERIVCVSTPGPLEPSDIGDLCFCVGDDACDLCPNWGKLNTYLEKNR